MRLLIATGLYPPDIGGPATYCKLLEDELPRYDFHIKVASFGSVRCYPRIFRHILYFFQLIKNGFSIDVIYALDPVSVGFPALIAAKILRKRFLLKIVGDYAWEQAQQRFGVKDLLDDFFKKKYGWKVETLRFIERITAKSAKKVIVPSEYLKRVVQSWGIEGQKIHVIYNSFGKGGGEIRDKENQGRLDQTPLYPPLAVGKEMDVSLRGCGGEEKPSFLLSAGRLVPWKGFDTLIELMIQLPEEITLLILGDGPQKDYLCSKVQALGLDRRVRLEPSVLHHELPRFFSQARVFVLNTAYEGLSHVILEAMDQAVPVITTPAGGNPELVSHRENGLLVEYNSQEQLKQAILELWFDDDLRKRLVNNAKQGLKRFSLEEMVARTVEALRTF